MGNASTQLSVNANPANPEGDVYISHREFLGNVTATGGSGNISPFELVTYPLNVGLNQTFPWLSQIAQNFSMYELIGCIFEYKPTSGELGATGSNTLGKVVMATQYDPDQPDFVSTVQMENYDYANACKPSEHMLHGVETAKRQRLTNLLYVRSGLSTKDKVLTDIGTFQIATEGLPITSGATAIVGELWVAYRVKLSRAQLYGSYMGNNVKFDQLIGQTDGTTIGATTSTYLSSGSLTGYYNLSPVANHFAQAKWNKIGCFAVGDNNKNFTLYFPTWINTGRYFIQVHVSQPSAAVANILTILGYNYLTLVNIPGMFNWGSATTAINPPVSAAQWGLTLNCIVDINAPNKIAGDIQFRCDTNAPANLSQFQIYVTQIPSDIPKI